MNGAFTLAVNTTGTTNFAGAAVGGVSVTTNVGRYDEPHRQRDHHGAQTFNDAVTLGGNDADELGGPSHRAELHGERRLRPRGEHHRGHDLRRRGGPDGVSVTTNVGGTTSIGANVTTTGRRPTTTR